MKKIIFLLITLITLTNLSYASFPISNELMINQNVVNKESLDDYHLELQKTLVVFALIYEPFRMIDALQHFEENGEVCPANWKKGDDAMKENFAGVADYLSKH